MPIPQFSGNASTRIAEKTKPNQTPVIALSTDEMEALRAVVETAGQHPTLIPALAKLLQLGGSTQPAHTWLGMALQGESLAPFAPGDWTPQIPSHAFDGGLARVLAEDGVARPVGLLQQVENSVLFARLIISLMGAIEDHDTDGIHALLCDHAAKIYRSGWLMAWEAIDFQDLTSDRNSRHSHMGRTVDDLVQLLNLGVVSGDCSVEMLTAPGLWNSDQVAEACRQRAQSVAWAAVGEVRRASEAEQGGTDSAEGGAH